jgi:hypothetical protein
MADEVKITEVAKEIREASEEDLREVIETWLERTRTQGMKLGAQMMALGVNAIIQKHLNKPGKNSFNDYKRCMKDISNFLAVQLKQDTTEQNNSTIVGEDDGEEGSI